MGGCGNTNIHATSPATSPRTPNPFWGVWATSKNRERKEEKGMKRKKKRRRRGVPRRCEGNAEERKKENVPTSAVFPF